MVRIIKAVKEVSKVAKSKSTTLSSQLERPKGLVMVNTSKLAILAMADPLTF